MQIPLKQKLLYKSLVDHFGGQPETVAALKVKQGTVSGWCRGKHGMSEPIAIKAEFETGGKFKASQLCPRLEALKLKINPSI